MATYRAGVIGLNLGIAHVNAYQAVPNVELVAIADISPDALSRVGDRYNVAARYADYREMLANERLDIVSVTTPARLHASMVIDAARQGVRAVLVEKPIALSMGEAETAVAACDRAGTKLIVGHQRRQLGEMTHARQLLSEGAIGRPLACSVMAAEGGLLNQGSHVIDMACYILGDRPVQWVVGQVQRITDRYERGDPCEDLCWVTACLEGGVRLTVDVDIEGQQQLGNRAYTFVGDRGVLHLTMDAKRDDVAYHGVCHSDTRGVLRFGADDFPRRDLFEAEVAELAAWLDGGPPHRQDAHHVLHSQAIMSAMYESARTRTLVQMPMRSRAAALDLMIAEGELPIRFPGAYDIRRAGWLPPRALLEGSSRSGGSS